MKERKKGKNRRDAHGVFERREARGKTHYDNEFGGKSNAGGGKSAYGKTGRESYSHEKSAYDKSSYGKSGYSKSARSGADRSIAGKQRNYSMSGGGNNHGKKYSGNGGRYERTGFDTQSRRYGNSFGNDADNGEETRAELLVGRNPVIEALRAGRDIERIYMAEGAGGSISIIRALAKERGVSISMVDRFKLDHMAPGEKHQGVVAEVPAYRYSEMQDIFARAAAMDEEPFIVILDEITDPHNVGAIIRSAECMGAHGIIIPNRRACGLTSTVAKSAAGAIEQIPVVRVTNIGRTIEELQAKGIWIAACDMDGEPYYRANLDGAVAIVIGNEGRGIGKLVKEKCDFTVSIPMKGKINSLNASNAAAVVMAEIRRRREV